MDVIKRPNQKPGSNRTKSGNAAWEAIKSDPVRLAEFKRIRSEAMKKFWKGIRELKKAQRGE